MQRFLTAGKTRLKTAPPSKKRNMAHYDELPVDKATYDLLPEISGYERFCQGMQMHCWRKPEEGNQRNDIRIFFYSPGE